MDNTITNEVINITLMDKQYQIKCPINEKTALLKAASFLEQRLVKIKNETRGAPLEHSIMLAALNISHDYLNKNNSKNNEIELLHDALKQLQQKLTVANTHSILTQPTSD